MSAAEQDARLNDWNIRFSAKFGRWAYTELPLSDRSKRAAMIIIGCDESVPWAYQFLMAELDLHWQDSLGSFIVSAIGRRKGWNAELISRLEQLFHNVEAHPGVRGTSLHVLGHKIWDCPSAEWDAFEDRLRSMCDEALWHVDPAMRRLACIAALTLGGYEARIHELALDMAIDGNGNSVASEAEKYDILD